MEVELPFVGEVDGGDLVAHGVGRRGWASTDFSLSFHRLFSLVFHFCLFYSSVFCFGSLFFPCYLNLVMEWQIGFGVVMEVVRARVVLCGSDAF